jgi:hypothetical protein
MYRHIKTKFNTKQLTDSCLALILLCLIVFKWKGINLSITLAVVVILLSMLKPSIIYPWAVVWYTLTELLGTILSKILLSVIYILIVWPVGFIRRIMGKDNLQLKNFNKTTGSVFRVREKKFAKNDLEMPY